MKIDSFCQDWEELIGLIRRDVNSQIREKYIMTFRCKDEFKARLWLRKYECLMFGWVEECCNILSHAAADEKKRV
jgi:hypothetical protein